MGIILNGVLTWSITYLTKRLSLKFGKKINGQTVVVILSLLFGFLYYLVNRLNPNIIEELSEVMAGGFAVSQSLYVFLRKFEPKN